MGEKSTPETLEDALKVITDLETNIAELEPKLEEWKDHSRTWEQRAKDNKAAADERDSLKTQIDELKTAQDADLDDAGKLEKRLSDAEAALEAVEEGRKADQDARAVAEKSALKMRIGTEKRLPSALIDLLQGDDEEAIAKHADTLLEAVPPAERVPGVPGQGANGELSKNDELLAAFEAGGTEP